MANLDAARGLQPVLNEAGTAPKIRTYAADAGGGSIFRGSLVRVIAGSGTDDEVIDIWDGADASSLIGVAAYQRATGDTARKVAVYVDPEQEFEIQVDDNSLTHESDYVGSHFNVIAAATGNATTLDSISEVDGSTAQAAADQTHVLLGLRKTRSPEVDYTSANPTIIVKIANSRHVLGTDGGVA